MVVGVSDTKHLRKVKTMKKYKKSFAVASILCLLLGAAGCGKDVPAEENEAESISVEENEAESISVEENEAENISEEAPSAGDGQVEEEKESTDISALQLFSATRIKHKIQTDDYVYSEEQDKSFPYGYMTYETFEISDEMQKLYPELSQALLTRSEWNEEDAFKALAHLGKEYQEMDGDFSWIYGSNYCEKSTMVQRADDKVFSVLVYANSFYNGPHPFNYWESYTYDTQTGEQIPLSDIVTDIRALPQLLLDNLQPIDEDYEFSDEEKEDMLGKIEEYVADNEICWVLTDEAFDVFFDAYDLQYYAFGPIFVSLTYEDFPDLLVPQYRFDSDNSSDNHDERFPAEDAGAKTYSWDKLEEYYDQYAEENG